MIATIYTAGYQWKKWNDTGTQFDYSNKARDVGESQYRGLNTR